MDALSPLIAYWPVILVAGGGLIAWGRNNARHDALEKQIEAKASKDTVASLDTRLDRIESKVDKLLER